MHLAGSDERRIYQLAQLGDGTKPTPITYEAYAALAVDQSKAG
jgi:hypothetical protein